MYLNKEQELRLAEKMEFYEQRFKELLQSANVPQGKWAELGDGVRQVLEEIKQAIRGL